MKFALPALVLGALTLTACDSTVPSVEGELASAPAALTAASATIGAPSVDGQTADPVSRLVLTTKGALSASARQNIEALGGTVVFSHKIGFTIVDGLDAAASEDLLAVSGVEAVETDVTIQRDPVVDELEAVEAGGQSPAGAFFYGLGYQWHMDAIGAPTAWAAGRTGSSNVTVAIIDSGLDDTHADLVGRVDASRSRSFLPAGEFDYLIGDVLFPSYPDYADFNSHGTHVGATVASNGIVGAGVTEDVTLLGIKVCRYNNSCSGSAIIAGLLYAADNGADVANMSLGGTFDKSDVASGGFPGYVGFLNRTFNYASRQGMTIVVSAGNSAADLDHDGDSYKTYCSTPATLCVSATGPQASDDIRVGPFYDVTAPARYTNYGRSAINVAAPGGDSKGFVWAACSSSRVTITPTPTGNRISRSSCTTSKTFITAKAGTSMASPHVSGLAALLVENYGRNPSQIQNRIQQTAEDLGQRGTDPFYGKGYINVPAALGLDV